MSNQGRGRPRKEDRTKERDDEHQEVFESSLELGGVSFDKIKRLDADFYVKEYPDMQFIWENDEDGRIELRIQQGFVPQLEESSRFPGHFPGLTDRDEGKYVSRVGGTNAAGSPLNVYLMKMPKDLYKKVKIDPLEKRNQDIQEAMGLSAERGDAQAREVAKDVETYEPYNPIGTKGFDKLPATNGIVQK